MPGAPTTPRGPAAPHGAEPHAPGEQRLPGIRPPTAGGAGPPRKTLHHHPSTPSQTPPARAPLRTAPLSVASPCPEAEEAAIKLGESRCGWMRGEGRDPGMARALPLPTQGFYFGMEASEQAKPSKKTVPWRGNSSLVRKQLPGGFQVPAGGTSPAPGSLGRPELSMGASQQRHHRASCPCGLLPKTGNSPGRAACHTPWLPAEVSPAPRGTRVSPVHTAAGNACPVTGLSPV